MEFSFDFADEPDLIVTLSGRVDAVGLRRLNDELVADARFKPGLTILADVSQLDISALTDHELAAGTAPVVERDWSSRPLAVAILAPTPAVFTAATLYRAHLGGSVSNRRVFNDRDAALAWLREKRGSTENE